MRAGRAHASDVRRARHEPAALRAPRGFQRRQRPLLRRSRPEEHHRALQLVPPHRHRRPAEARMPRRRRCRRPRRSRARRWRLARASSRCRAFSPSSAQDASVSVASVIGALNEQGYWLAPLGTNSHPYRGPGPAAARAGRFLADPRRRRERHLAVSRTTRSPASRPRPTSAT